MANTTFTNIAASTTDGIILSAITGNRIRVLGIIPVCGGTATTLVFNSKGSGAGTAITATFALAANGGFVLPTSGDTMNEVPWFQTNLGEALTATTGTGSTIGIHVVYDIFGI